MINRFSDYWVKKAKKRRKSWAEKARRFAVRHMQLEEIRKEVFYNHVPKTNVMSLLEEHQTVRNPISQWGTDLRFSFSEQGLREALLKEGADISSLSMTVNRKSIVGQQPHDVEYNNIKDVAYNRSDLYKKCTDLETCTINYGGVTMTIYRYTYLGQPFAWYELLPCWQLSLPLRRFQETDFNILNIATLLLEMAAEYELRQEELNYYAKKLKLRTMDAALTDDISFELWDDKKLEKKVAEYFSKDYPGVKVLDFVLRPWKQAITKYFDAITEQEIQNAKEKLDAYTLKHNFRYYVEKVLQPYFIKHGLQELKMWKPEENSSDLYIESQGYLAKYDAYNHTFWPNAHYSMSCIGSFANKIPLRALAYYLKEMPEISKKTDEVVVKTLRIYDQLMQQKNENYRQDVESLDSLAAQHKGKPVGKMMKFWRWSKMMDRFVKGNLESDYSISSIKVLGETSFSFVERSYFSHNEEVKERWLDADCQNVYVADPVTTDFEEWEKKHRRGMLCPAWSWSARKFLGDDSGVLLSIDFINQKF